MYRIGRVTGSGTVATFAMDAQFVELDLTLAVERHRSGRVALEAALDAGLRV
jgi:hypothetical protein